MSYTCPDCEDGVLEAKYREIELEEGETAQVIGGVVFATHVACNNGCSAETEEEKPKRKKRTPATSESDKPCTRNDDCARPYAHTGMCNHKRGTAEE